MTLSLHHRRINGAPVKLVVTVAADGAVEYWRPEDPATGEHVVLSSMDRWYAVLVMNRALSRMPRGAT